MAEVHAITNGITVETGKPCLDVVDFIEQLLAMAKSGEIIGIAVATIEPQHRIADAYRIGDATDGDMMLAIHSLHTRFTRAWYAMATPDDSVNN